jgi:thioredoxin 1
MAESKNTIKVTDGDFDTLTKEGNVLVDFWAEWCTPCHMIAPVLEEIAKEMDGKLTIAKLNVDENSETPQKFGVQSIPTLILFKDGKLVERVVGAVPKASLVQAIEKHIN